MPHAVFNLGPQTTTADLAARSLIPGIAPGGSRAGQATKPALLIQDAWIEVVDIVPFQAADFNMATYSLKLSQETDLTPGLILPVGQLGQANIEVTAVGQRIVGIRDMTRDLFHAQGTVWAPRMVGIHIEEVGTINQDVDVHLDYQQVDVPWMDWFIMWDFLDNIVDNELEY